MKRTCFSCQSPIRDGFDRCESCGKWNFVEAFVSTRKTILSKVRPDPIPRLTSGPWDPCFGGGIVRSSVTLLAGEPGAGKSTLLLQLANSISGPPEVNRHTVYIATEENEEQIKERADRLKLANQDCILIVNAMGGMSLTNLLEETKPYFVILDSLPGFTGKGTNKDEAIQVIRALKGYAERNHAPAIVTDHITKDLDFAGYMSLMHAVDCLLMFTKRDIKADPRARVFAENRGIKVARDGNYRVLTTDKNRHGPAPKSTVFEMTTTGLINAGIGSTEV